MNLIPELDPSAGEESGYVPAPGFLDDDAAVTLDRVKRNLDVRTGRPLGLSSGYHQFQLAMKGQLGIQLSGGMGSGQFPLFLADDIRRTVWDYIETEPGPYAPFFSRGPADKVAPEVQKIYEVTGAVQPMREIGERADYPYAEITEALLYSVTVRKFGRKWGWTLEHAINGARSYLDSMPKRMAEAWRNTLDYNRTKTLFTTTGWNTTSSQGVIPTDPLGFDTLGAAYNAMRVAVTNSVDNLPAPIMPTHLMVAPALEIEARRILNSTFIDNPAATGLYGTDNSLGKVLSGVQLVVNPWIPTVVTSATKDTLWGLFALGGSNRPVAWEGFLRGYENPEIAVRTTGLRDNMSFENDTVDYRIRGFAGWSLIDGKYCYLSNGA